LPACSVRKAAIADQAIRPFSSLDRGAQKWAHGG
jgi:hypothetical protein